MVEPEAEELTISSLKQSIYNKGHLIRKTGENSTPYYCMLNNKNFRAFKNIEDFAAGN